MELNSSLCYRAVQSRDRRFDGRFFTAVLTTGIYCRPICPARTPKRENVRFFACAAAAEQAGFRPCLRCRPETSPGTPAWNGTSGTVHRALRLISEGDLDENPVEVLAERLGVGDRHLRRLFMEHLGAPPRAIAQTRRVHFARRLIDETDLPMTEVAAAAGFSSLRRFNHAVRETFGQTPTALRGTRDPATAERRSATLTLRLPYRPPFHWSSIVDYLGPRAIPGVEEVTSDRYRRSFCLQKVNGILEVRPASRGDYLLLTIPLIVGRELVSFTACVRRIFDLGADPERIGSHLRQDRLLAPLVRKRPGIRVPGTFDPFELAIRAILGQQVSVAGATNLAGRIARAHGSPLGKQAAESITHRFPTPNQLSHADPGSLGMPRARGEAIVHLATAVKRGKIRLDGSSDPTTTIAALEAIPGIGPWTSAYIALRGLGEPDVIPIGDLGLRRAFSEQSRVTKRIDRALVEHAEQWRPWRSYAAMHLWLQGSVNESRR